MLRLIRDIISNAIAIDKVLSLNRLPMVIHDWTLSFINLFAKTNSKNVEGSLRRGGLQLGFAFH